MLMHRCGRSDPQVWRLEEVTGRSRLRLVKG